MKAIRFDVPDEIYDELMRLISHHGEKTHILRRALMNELTRLREEEFQRDRDKTATVAQAS